MTRNPRKLILVCGAVTAAISGACSHPATRRAPAADSPDLSEYSANFTLIRDPEVDRIVRVFHGSPGSKPVRIRIANPGGQLACQAGMPASADASPTRSGDYVFDARPDQDLYCFLASGSPASASIRVDYLYPKASAPLGNAPSTAEANPEANAQADAENLSAVQAEVAALLTPDIALAQRYNSLVTARAKAAEEARIAHENEMRLTETFFPSSVAHRYRPGPHTFQIVPVQRTLATAQGNSVAYSFQDGLTPYYPEDPRNSEVTAHENVFEPVAALLSNEHWDEVNQAPWEMIICPDKVPAAAAAVQAIANRGRSGILTTRQELWDTLMPFGALNASDCDPSWFATQFREAHPVFRTLYFQRQSSFRFIYVKTSYPVRSGGDTVNMAVYAPNRIEALYLAPNGARVYKILSAHDNSARAPSERHPFFGKSRLTQSLFSDSGSLRPEIPIDKPTLFPALGPDGIIEGLSLSR